MGACVVCNGFQNFVKQIAILGFGFLFIVGAILLFVLLSPLLLFRLILNEVAKLVRPDLGDMVSATGNLFSDDLLSSKAPRCSIIVSMLMEGNITDEECDMRFNRMVKKTNPETGKFLYPEVRQYVEKWCGFTFWKDDPNFNLKNHLVTYVPENPNKPVLEEEMTLFTEKLLNKPFPPKRSPWEMNIIRNYEDPNLPPGKKTLLLFRVHHSMADGYSIVHALVEGVLETPLTVMNLPKPNYHGRSGLSQFWSTLTFPARLLNDVSQYFIKALRKSPLNIPDAKKEWRQIYGKTRPVPIDKIKEIKTKLNVSFTSVLLAAVSASMSRVLRVKNKEMKKGNEEIDEEERAAFFIPLPLPGHPNALRNHATGAQIDLPLQNYSDPTMRVFECEKLIQEQKKSTIPWLLIFLGRTVGLFPSALCGLLTANRVNISGLTSFPGGNNVLGLGDWKLMEIEAAVGALTGISGCAFIAISYHKQMRFTVTAEAAALTRKDVDGLLTLVTDEIDLLYDIVKTDKYNVAPPY